MRNLALKYLHKAIIPSAASFYVPTIPGLVNDGSQPPVQVWSGHLLAEPYKGEVSKDVQAHLFFLLLKARRSADKRRLIFWLNGGPGCSSFDGLMMEVGPWRMDGKGGLKMVSGGWDEYADVVFGQPTPSFATSSRLTLTQWISQLALDYHTLARTIMRMKSLKCAVFETKTPTRRIHIYC